MSPAVLQACPIPLSAYSRYSDLASVRTEKSAGRAIALNTCAWMNDDAAASTRRLTAKSCYAWNRTTRSVTCTARCRTEPAATMLSCFTSTAADARRWIRLSFSLDWHEATSRDDDNAGLDNAHRTVIDWTRSSATADGPKFSKSWSSRETHPYFWRWMLWRCLSYRASAGGYLLIECRGVAALQVRSSQ